MLGTWSVGIDQFPDGPDPDIDLIRPVRELLRLALAGPLPRRVELSPRRLVDRDQRGVLETALDRDRVEAFADPRRDTDAPRTETTADRRREQRRRREEAEPRLGERHEQRAVLELADGRWSPAGPGLRSCPSSPWQVAPRGDSDPAVRNTCAPPHGGAYLAEALAARHGAPSLGGHDARLPRAVVDFCVYAAADGFAANPRQITGATNRVVTLASEPTHHLATRPPALGYHADAGVIVVGMPESVERIVEVRFPGANFE